MYLCVCVCVSFEGKLFLISSVNYTACILHQLILFVCNFCGVFCSLYLLKSLQENKIFVRILRFLVI